MNWACAICTYGDVFDIVGARRFSPKNYPLTPQPVLPYFSINIGQATMLAEII